MQYFKWFGRFFLLSGLFVLVANSVQANPIFYEVENLAGSRWEYSYTVENQTASPIDEFTIYFDIGLYTNLEVTGFSSLDWDGFASAPGDNLPDDDFVDWCATGPFCFEDIAGIDLGQTLSGFTVEFDWLGAGVPGSQFFEIVNPEPFEITSTGFTRLLEVNPPSVPEPLPSVLVGLGLLALLRRKANRRQ